MYDRTTWIVLILCGGLLAVNFHFAQQTAKERSVRQAQEQAERRSADPAAPTDPAAAPTADLTVEPAPPIAEEELVTLENDRVVFTITNIGGGIKYADFKDEFEVGSDQLRVRMNRFGSGPIGAIAGSGENLENITYSYRPEESIPGQKTVLIAKLPSGLIAKKTFSLVEDQKAGAPFLLDFNLTLENAAPVSLNLSQWSLFLGEASPLYQKEVIQQTGFFWREDRTMHFEHAGAFSGGILSSAKSLITSNATEQIEYAGVTNQFFATVMRPSEPQDTSVWARSTMVTLADDNSPLPSVRAGLRLPSADLNPGQQISHQYQVFIGPKHNTMLRKMDRDWGEGWGDVMQYGWFWWVSRPLNWLLNTYHNLLDGVTRNWSWGIAIILLTITVRIFIWPLHAKSTRTMKRMSKLQPEMAKLKEKYPDDPNKLNTEMMGLYRKYGINPLGGCLPMLLQIPIFFGFYRMLQYAVELRHQGFLWVTDLSQPDTVATVAGIPINLLPIVMGITSFLQIAITPKTGDKMQQRIIMFMPLIFFIFCYNFAAALALYWTTQNIFSIGQTWLMNKMPEPELKARPGAGTTGKKSWVERMAEKQAEMQRQREQQGKGAKTGMRDVTPADKKKRPPRTGG
jgi:YidC/Oxa1 family membrane protein insertase